MSFCSIYCNIVKDWSIPLAHIIHYYCEKHNTHVYREIMINIVLAPFHLVLFFPAIILATTIGFFVALYRKLIY